MMRRGMRTAKAEERAAAGSDAWGWMTPVREAAWGTERTIWLGALGAATVAFLVRTVARSDSKLW